VELTAWTRSGSSARARRCVAISRAVSPWYAQTVRVLLERDPRVLAFGDAPGEAGGWGATWVRLR
jgi:DNA-nicking Smr family endonuclease